MLDFSNGTGHIFNRLGADIASFLDAETYQKTTSPGMVSRINAQYLSNLSLIPNLQNWLLSVKNSAKQIKVDLQWLAQNTLQTMVQADAPQPAINLSNEINQLIAEMVASSATVKANTIGSSVTAGASNAGNGSCVVSTTDVNGTTLEYLYNENVTITCTRDSQPGVSAPTSTGQEVFTSSGYPVIDPLEPAWPGGSGGATQITASSADVSFAVRNAVMNGNFEAFVSNTPTNWTIATGTAGTTVLSTATAYRGATALSITGNGAELTKLTQTIRDVSSSVAGPTSPATKYCLAFRLRVSAVPAAGVLRVSLQDGSGTIIGSSNVSVTLSGATTGYVLHTLTFNTPASLPDKIVAVVELTTALDNAKSVYFDDLVVTPMTRHQNGPYFAIIPGSAKFAKGDTFTVGITNDYAGGFQTAFARLFGMAALGRSLPSSGSPSISDSLIA